MAPPDVGQDELRASAARGQQGQMNQTAQSTTSSAKRRVSISLTETIKAPLPGSGSPSPKVSKGGKSPGGQSAMGKTQSTKKSLGRGASGQLGRTLSPAGGSPGKGDRPQRSPMASPREVGKSPAPTPRGPLSKPQVMETSGSEAEVKGLVKSSSQAATVTVTEGTGTGTGPVASATAPFVMTTWFCPKPVQPVDQNPVEKESSEEPAVFQPKKKGNMIQIQSPKMKSRGKSESASLMERFGATRSDLPSMGGTGRSSVARKSVQGKGADSAGGTAAGSAVGAIKSLRKDLPEIVLSARRKRERAMYNWKRLSKTERGRSR